MHCCKLCNKKYAQRSSLWKHEKFEHEGRPKPAVKREQKKCMCTICGKILAQSWTLARHIELVHTTDSLVKESEPVITAIFTCQKCGKQFPVKKKLIWHMRCHREKTAKKKIIDEEGSEQKAVTVVQKFPCDKCDNCYSRKDGLHKHVNAAHSNNPDSAYLCPMCGKSFGYSAALHRHQVTVHSEVKKFVCEICGKRFKLNYNLRLHMRIHPNENAEETGMEKAYSCTTCGQKFKYKTSMRSHMLLHSEKRRFSCRICNKGFNNSDNYKKHQRVHSGEKPFLCNICGKSFSDRSNCGAHMKRIHGITAREQIVDVIKGTNCIICNENFPNPDSCREHFRGDHGTEWLLAQNFARCERKNAEKSVSDLGSDPLSMENIAPHSSVVMTGHLATEPWFSS